MGPATDRASDPVRDDPRPSRRARLARSLLPGLLAVLLVAVLATAVVQVLDRSDDADGASAPVAGDGAVLLARRATSLYFSLDAAGVDAHLRAMRRLATSAFEHAYATKVRHLAPRVRRDRIVLRAALPGDGVATEYLSATTASILVSVDVARSSRDSPVGVSHVAARVSLRRVHGRWLVSGLDEVG